MKIAFCIFGWFLLGITVIIVVGLLAHWATGDSFVAVWASAFMTIGFVAASACGAEKFLADNRALSP